MTSNCILGKRSVSISFSAFSPIVSYQYISNCRVEKGEWAVKEEVLTEGELADYLPSQSCSFCLDTLGMFIQAEFRMGTVEMVSFEDRDKIVSNLHLPCISITKDVMCTQSMYGIIKSKKAYL